jgi:hypothetical protein
MDVLTTSSKLWLTMMLDTIFKIKIIYYFTLIMKNNLLSEQIIHGPRKKFKEIKIKILKRPKT